MEEYIAIKCLKEDVEGRKRGNKNGCMLIIHITPKSQPLVEYDGAVQEYDLPTFSFLQLTSNHEVAIRVASRQG